MNAKVSEYAIWMGHDQFGHHYDLGPTHPRKALIEKLGGSPRKMYVDKKDGSTVHTGYVIRGYWVTLYQIRAMENPS